MSNARDNSTKLRGKVYFSAYLPDTTGATSVSTLLKTAMQDAMASGKSLVVDQPGTYLMGSVCNPTMSADLTVDCAPGVNFVASASMNNRMFFFSKNTATTGGLSLRWKGGRTDMSAVGLGSSGTAWDHFFTGEQFDTIIFEDLEIYSGEDYTANHGDSGIFSVSRGLKIINCRFQGCWDAAIYLSGTQLQVDGEDALIEGCRFIKCRVGPISKRLFRRYTVTNNFFDRCETAIATAEADTTLLAGTNNIITGNHIVQPKATGIQIGNADSTIVANNRIEDQGYDLSDTAVSVSYGIALKGARNCIVADNVIVMRRFPSPSASHRGIQLERRTWNGIDYDCTYNLVAGNRIDGVSQGIRENDANQDFNRFVSNLVTNSTSVSIKSGANSFWMEYDNPAAGRAAFVGTLSLGGNFGSESLRVNPIAGAVNFLSVSGSTGTAPLLQAIGTGADLDVRIIPKGAGVLRIDGVSTTVPATAGSVYKDASGFLKIV